MAVNTPRKRWSMLGFGSMGSHIPLPDGELDVGDRATLLGLYRRLTVVLRKAVSRGPRHAKKQRLSPPMLDFEKVRLDRLAATEAKEGAMLTARIGTERANIRMIVGMLASADDQRQRHLQMQIAQIEMRIKDLQMHLSKLKGGLHQ